MAFSLREPYIGAPSFTDADAITYADSPTTHRPKVPLGTILKGVDPTYGEGEFIYLRGVAAGAVGDVVNFDQNFQTKRAVLGDRGQLAVAMAAVGANQFGWYQISGIAVVKTAVVAANVNLQLTATAGQVDDLAVATQSITNFVSKTADGTPSAGYALVSLTRPEACGVLP